MLATKTARSKKMEVKRNLIKQYDLPSIAHSRWGSAKRASRTDMLRGMLWTVFSAFIRKRDGNICISCGKVFGVLQAGHYVPVSGSGVELWFDEKNVNGECEKCNAFDDFHLVTMRLNMIMKYGRKAVEKLEQARFAAPVFWTEEQYVTKIKYYYHKINK